MFSRNSLPVGEKAGALCKTTSSSSSSSSSSSYYYYSYCGQREEWEEREEEEKLQPHSNTVTKMEPDVKLEVFEKDSVLYEEETIKLRPVHN